MLHTPQIAHGAHFRLAAELARERQIVALKAASPLRSAAAQHDVDGLALFDQPRQPALF